MEDRHKRIVVGLAYALVIALLMYLSIREGLGVRLAIWNCVPATLGVIAINSAIKKSRRALMASIAFGGAAAAVSLFFVGAWFFTQLDIDRHSSMTAVVFVFVPLWSIGIGTIACAIIWSIASAAAIQHSANTR